MIKFTRGRFDLWPDRFIADTGYAPQKSDANWRFPERPDEPPARA
jgi:hypothetical protein